MAAAPPVRGARRGTAGRTGAGPRTTGRLTVAAADRTRLDLSEHGRRPASSRASSGEARASRPPCTFTAPEPPVPHPPARRAVGSVVVGSVLAMAAVLLLWQTIDGTCRDERAAGGGAESCAGVPVADQTPIDLPSGPAVPLVAED
ncbi:hypothetical protein FTX61_16910 [Nitriliruptoraceae bacterium ZYF776]|nr:hypothetical protein [Profundirhabdus halotolerans]